MKQLTILSFMLCLLFNSGLNGQTIVEAKDKEILEDIFSRLKNDKDKTTAELVVLAGQLLVGTPYVANTLETEPEQLVINLHGMDCTTYAENCLAIARVIKNSKASFHSFAKELTNIRYRHGKIETYPSRLHYFSDWIYENDKKKLVNAVSGKIAKISYSLDINFMSTHPTAYKPLKNNPDFIPLIAEKEREISARTMYYLPKEKLSSFEGKIRAGDIVGITTSISGLDIVHVGIVVKLKEQLHLMHASSKAEKVIISEKSLSEYVKGRKSASGIMLARPL